MVASRMVAVGTRISPRQGGWLDLPRGGHSPPILCQLSWRTPSWVDAVENVPSGLATNFPPKDESRDNCSSICPQAGYQSHRRVHRFAMPPPHIYKDRRAYGSENLCSARQKDFFDNIGQSRRLTIGRPRTLDISLHCVNRHFAPFVDGSRLARTFFTPQTWSVLPSVRRLGAVHMTAGHNALRGSGPSQQHAFDDAMAQVGCPDRRIDRLCITSCSPSQPFTSRRMPDAISFTAQARWVLVAFAPGHHSPGHPRNLVGKCNGGNLGRAPRQQRREPGPMAGAMDLGIADDSECSGHEGYADSDRPVC